MKTISQIETSSFMQSLTKIVSIFVPWVFVVFIATPAVSLSYQNMCANLFQRPRSSAVVAVADKLGKQDGVQIKKPTEAFLRKLELNKEPALKYLQGEAQYEAPQLKIFDNRRLYEPQFMLRFDGVRLIKMFRGLRLEEGSVLQLKSEKKGRPIWIAPDYEHARLYAQEWTPVENAEKATPIVLEMWVPEFMIYWRNDPREEGMVEAFILDKDIQTLESFITKLHKLKPKADAKTESSDVTLEDYYRFGYPPYE